MKSRDKEFVALVTELQKQVLEYNQKVTNKRKAADGWTLLMVDLALLLEGIEAMRKQTLEVIESKEVTQVRLAYLKQRGDEFKGLLELSVMGAEMVNEKEEPEPEPKAEFIKETG